MPRTRIEFYNNLYFYCIFFWAEQFFICFTRGLSEGPDTFNPPSTFTPFEVLDACVFIVPLNAQILFFNKMLKFFIFFKSFVTCISVTVVGLSFTCLLYKFSQQDNDIYSFSIDTVCLAVCPNACLCLHCLTFIFVWFIISLLQFEKAYSIT